MKSKILGFFFLAFFVSQELRAQLVEVPLPLHSAQSAANSARRAAFRTVTFPFWDDFSKAQGVLSDTLWFGSRNVAVKIGIGVENPTQQVAVLDAMRADGTTYSLKKFYGPLDSLTSQAVAMSRVPTALRPEVRLSFFWQAGGRGLQPNAGDSLLLDFKGTSGDRWYTVWRKQVEDNMPEGFTQAFVSVPDTLFHDGFQFRFRAFGNQSGAYDVWLLDYILLTNRWRSEQRGYFDRSIETESASLLKPYYSMPLHHFLADPVKYSQIPSLFATNLNSRIQPVSYTVRLEDHETETEFQRLANEVPDNLPAQSRLRLTGSRAVDPALLEGLGKDSLTVDVNFFLNSGDNFLINRIGGAGDTLYYAKVDLRENDTLRTQVHFGDFFAYDDGTAEHAAGINQANGELAYQYVFGEKDTITAVRIYFPKIGASGPQIPFQMKFWSKLDTMHELHAQNFVTQLSTESEPFAEYKLSSPVIVEDTVYIGWQQSTDDFLAVGLDKNTNSSQRMFYRVSGMWRENTEVEGSLMIRPVVRDVEQVVTSVGSDEHRFYPNPSESVLSIRAALEDVRVIDLAGKAVHVDISSWENFTRLVFPNSSFGTYLIHFRLKGKQFTERVYIR